MRTLRLIVYVLLLANLLVFVFYNRIMHASAWSMLVPVNVFMFAGFSLVLLVFMYDFFTFKYSDPAKRKGLPLILLVFVLALLAWINPFNWPLQNEKKLHGYWHGKAASGRLTFYKDGLFEIVWNGYARDGKYHGTWSEKKDTFALKYIGKKLDRVGDTLVLQENLIIPLNGYDDFLLRSVEFTVDQ